MELRFTKMHGIGNDFVMIEDDAGAIEMTPEAVQWFCDRHFGIGADGLIIVRPATSGAADYYMDYHNADGSLAEMCGNGARCFAKYLADRGLVPAGTDTLVIETLGGVRHVAITRSADGMCDSVTVDMGRPVFEAASIPTTLAGGEVTGVPLETPQGTFDLTAVSMGNPHAITWVDDVEAAPVETAGPAIERHEAFPRATNVEFAQIVDGSTVRVRVWERGVGETLACGTGACAVAVAAIRAGHVTTPVTVELPGGELTVAWDGSGSVLMTGSATEVFTGTLDVPDEA